MNEITVAPQTAVARATPADLLRVALDSNADLDRLERLMRLQQEWEANEARKAYVAAIATFKKNPPTILKEKRVHFETSRGKTSYMHATLGDVTQPIIEGLAAVGISHRWDVEQPDGGMISVRCILTHEQGHSESVVMRAGRDDSGGKNAIQQVASTITYLERYTLLSITGLATHDMPDNDGRGAPESKSETTVQQTKAVKLDQVLKALRDANTPDELAAATDLAGQLADTAEKQVASSAYKKRLAELKAAARAQVLADLEAKVRACKTLSEAEEALAGATLTDAERARLEEIAAEVVTQGE